MGTQPARGMRDFLPDDVRRRTYVIDAIQRIYARYGFEPLETPAVENLDTLLGKYGDEGDRLIFKILKRGEEGSAGHADLGLRYDLTVPLARVVAEYRAALPRFFKRYQIQPVWRADRPQRGRFREFYQCDVDILGSTSPMVEVEICAAASDALTELGFQDFTIRLNHRQLLRGMLAATGVGPDQESEALVALDKLDKIGRNGVEREFASRGIPPGSAQALLSLLHDAANAAPDGAAGASPVGRADTETLARIRRFIQRPEASGTHRDEALAAADVLEQILELAGRTPAGGRLLVDPSLARGLSYYTGAIMEIAVPDLAGSLGGGGRYDELVGMFLGHHVPACGFSLGLERIIVVMTERGMFPPQAVQSAVDVLVTLWSASEMAESLALAAELRGAGLRVDVYPEADKIGRQFKYAAARHTRFVAIVGDDERAKGEVAIKNLDTGEQTPVARAAAAAWLRNALATPAANAAGAARNR